MATKKAGCFMCQDPMFTKKGSQYPPIADLDVCTAILNLELHHLTSELQHRFMDDAACISVALEKTFPNVKLNHGLFGNTTPHLHWHITVRRETDPDPRATIWESPFPKLTPSDDELLMTAGEIRQNL